MEKKYLPKISSKINNLILLFILFISFVIISSSFKQINFAARSDEGHYFKCATYIAEKGIFGFPKLFKVYVENDKNWFFLSHLRVGFIILSSLWLKIFGYSLLNLAYLSLFAYTLFLLASFHFVKKYFSQTTALLFVLLLAFSPINMAMARRALTESTLSLFSILSIWLFFDYIREKSNFKQIIFILTYSFTILVKETSVLLSLVFMIFIVSNKFLFKEKIHLREFLTASVFPFTIAGVIYLSLAGGILPITDTVKVILHVMNTNQYAVFFSSGPWFSYIVDYILLSPWVVILAIGFIFHYLSSKESDVRIFYFLLVLIVIFISFNAFSKNIRYVMILDTPLRLFSVLILKKIFETKFPKQALTLAVMSVITIATFDYLNFYKLFLLNGIYDPVSLSLIKASAY